MKVTIPDELKKDVPLTTFGKILSATPVVMAVVATMLAGLASSEMTRAQYDRSLAAQQQSKAGDQWSFFQAKRLRGAYQQNTADLLQSIAEVHAVDPAAVKKLSLQLPDNPEGNRLKTDLAAALDSRAGQQAISLLQTGNVPTIPPPLALSPSMKSALDAVENLKTDAEVAAALSQVQNRDLDEALRAAQDQAKAFDVATKPVNQVVDHLENLLGKMAALLPRTNASAEAGGKDPLLNRDFTASRLKYTAQRYEVEARLNQSIANIYELQVRKSNISAERHHNRSQRFFFGMLGAQLAVIMSTFAMAARNKNLLWSLAAIAGLLAVIFAIYVYLRF
jgi:hypothetical protein